MGQSEPIFDCLKRGTVRVVYAAEHVTLG